MNEHLRERILRRLDSLSDERGYQVLDYVEFLESRYAERQTATSAFSRFTDAVEDRLRAGKVSATAIAETMNLMNRAANVLGGALAATQKMATEFVNTPPSGAPGSSPASTTRPVPPAQPSTAQASTAQASTAQASGVSPAATQPASAQTSPSMAASPADDMAAPPPRTAGEGFASSPAETIEAPGAPGEKL